MVEYWYFHDKDGNVLPPNEVLELIENLRADVIQILENNDI